jgi:hypothetical protein
MRRRRRRRRRGSATPSRADVVVSRLRHARRRF